MKKIFLLIVLCSLNIFTIQAQIPGIVFSSDKTPQKDGIAKLKILKNGNTASFEMITDVGIVCKLYDVNKKKTNEVVTPLLDDIRKYRMRGVFEINSDLMAMVVFYEKGVPKLYRYLYDGTTGKLKSAAVILELPELAGTPKLRTKVGSYTLSDFIIKKDPISDNYAVALCDIFAKDPNKQVEVVHYSSTHEIINRAFFTTPDNTFKNNLACDLYVNGTTSVLLASYVTNSTKAKIGEAAYYYISQLSAGSTSFKNKVLMQTIPFERLIDRDCKLVYDHVKGNVNALVKSYNSVNGEWFYSFVNKSINPKSIEIGAIRDIKIQKAQSYFKSNIDPKNDYKGIVNSYVIDQAGNDLYLTQPIKLIVYGQEVTQADVESVTKSLLFDIGVTCVSSDGAEKYGNIIPYTNSYYGPAASSIYTNAKRGEFLLTTVDEFYGSYVDVVPGKVNNYVLFNNTTEYFERPENVRTFFANGVWMNSPYFTSFVYTYSSTGGVKKEYMFGKPATEKEAKYGLFQTADYNSETGMYATHVVEFVNGKKTVSIAWISLK